MPRQYFVFTNLADQSSAHIGLASDSGWSAAAVPGQDPKGRPGQVFDIPDFVPGEMGAQLNIDAPGMNPTQLRGILSYLGPEAGRAYLLCDDFVLVEAAVVQPPIPPPTNPSSPLDVINSVYATGAYNLATKTGCGTFTEECCRQLASLWGTPPWGHVAKAPGQNQFNAHAVDAIMSLYGEDDGIWDIIYSSVSSEARPVFNRAGDVKGELWRPPSPLPCVPATSKAASADDVKLTFIVSAQDLKRLFGK